jgi:hypothetical protein
MGKSNHPKIIDFRLRACYPNYRCLRRLMPEFEGREPAGCLPFDVIPELEYFTDRRRKPVPFAITHADVPLLVRGSKEDTIRYLDFLVRSRNGETDAFKQLTRIREEYRREKKKIFINPEFIEDDNVIPCTTEKKYDDVLLSQKGKMLLDLYQEGYPVPDFCIMTSRSYHLSAEEREKHLVSAISNLEKMTGSRLGAEDKWLIFAMRCATPQYIPGLMPTYLNVGVTKNVYRSILKVFGKDVADKIYLNNLKTIHQALFWDKKYNRGAQVDFRGEHEVDAKISYLYRKIEEVNPSILLDAYSQASFFMNKSHDFFIQNQDLIYTFQRGQPSYPSLVLQKMVWTVRDEDSYPGVLYSRHPRTGLGMQIESVRAIFGEEIMTGTIHADQKEYFDREEIKSEFPAIYHFTPMLPNLEVKLKSPATIEFAVETIHGASFFAILQLNPSELTGRSTLLSAIDLYQKKIISRHRVIQLIRPYHLRQIFSERIDDESLHVLTYFGSGISVLPRSAVSTRIYFSMAKALEAKKRGEKVCLCKDNFIPSETIFMAELDVIMSMNPLAIHVVTACLGYGIPAFIDLKNQHMQLKGNSLVNEMNMVINEGDWITVSSKRHSVYLGKAIYKPARFQKYLEGHKLEMDKKEETVFINMAIAYKEYQEILNAIQTEESMTLSDLVKLIRNDYDSKPKKATEFVNAWFDSHSEYYFNEILKSGLGSHLDQHKIYSFLTTDRKVTFYTNMIKICRKHGKKGFTAGSFMLGRFLCQSHPISFWKEFDPPSIVFLLNEYILFEKYMQVLTEFGERHISRTKNKILTDELEKIPLSFMDPTLFMTLKMHITDWGGIEKHITSENDPDIRQLVTILQKPYGYFFNYDAAWSLDKLQIICDQEKLPVPDKDSV